MLLDLTVLWVFIGSNHVNVLSIPIVHRIAEQSEEAAIGNCMLTGDLP
jgi:hypothetical protein